MPKGWLAMAILVMLSATVFDLQMQDRDGQHSADARLYLAQARVVQATPTDRKRLEILKPGSNSEMERQQLQARLQTAPDSLLAKATAACALDSWTISEASLAGCFQARLEASTDKDVRFWEHFSGELSSVIIPEPRTNNQGANLDSLSQGKEMFTFRQTLPLS